ncbi:choice-of-anchor D domain-containing protein [Desulfococcaceae bacterium HSG7]|nr:choice-of-anchor D domain-containing protein [Desulfococcaceae bacterium HSG7]
MFNGKKIKKDRLLFKKALIFLCAAIFMGGLIASPASSGQWSNIGDLDNEVRVMIGGSDGNLYVGGKFTDIDGGSISYIARRNVTTGVWEELDTITTDGAFPKPSVRAIVFDSTGNLYVGGEFDDVNGDVTMKRIAKMDTSGAWSSIGEMNGDVRALVFDSAGNLYAGGEFQTADGVLAQRIAKMDTDGDWNNIGNMSSYVRALVFDNNGNLYAGDDFPDADGVTANKIAKMGTDGDWSNIGNMDSTVRALAIDSAGNLYAGGDFTDADGVTAERIAKLDAPEIDLTQGGTSIADGGTYNFGHQVIGSHADVILTIENTGDADLTLATPLTIGDAYQSEFLIIDQPTAFVEPGHQTTFTVRFIPVSAGAKTATISIENNDGDENPYDLIIMGTAPEINLKQGVADIADGGSYDFGTQVTGSDADTVFTIQNTGDADLTLTTPVTVGGTDQSEFSIVTQPTSPVTPDGSTTFTVRFSPASTGAKTATISIGNNDDDETPYELNLNGTGTPASEPLPEPLPVPSVLNVTSTASSDTYSAGSVIVLTVHFSVPVWVKGAPQLVLNTGGPAPGKALYSGGSGTDMLTFRYIVADGDDISDLDYWSEWALELNSGRIYSNQDIEADLDLSVPGEQGSVGYNTEAGVFGVMYPVYRFYSPGLSKHLFTIDENEKEHLIQKASEVWRFEDIAYYAYRAEQYDNGTRQQKSMLQAVHRFYSETLQTHLFTVDENEKNTLIETADDIWRFEGVAYHAFP